MDFSNMSRDASLMKRDIICPALAMRVGARLCIVMMFQMAHPLVFTNETPAAAGHVGTRVFRVHIMGCGNVPLQIVVCPERGFVFALLDCAN
jgi:hypothetical protein